MKEEAIKAPGSTIRQYSIMLQNRVGALSALLGLLDMHGIFCLGFSMHDCHEATIARLIVSDPERTSEIFLEKGICYTESEVLVAVLRHGPADLKKCLDVLYAAEMNVNFLYPLMPCICLLYTSDAADDLLCVDFWGRRIIKKKKYAQTRKKSEKQYT